MVFRKTQSIQPADFYYAEAAGLDWLKKAGLPVPEVLSVTDSAIELQELRSVRPQASDAYRFGQQLALCHQAGAAQFGSKPDNYHGALYIGKKAMPAGCFAQWGEFYVQERVLPFIPAAKQLGMLSDEDADATYRACDLIASGFFDDDAEPARIHGDLWSGNVFFSAQGVYAIDPAAHGGHRETDLAMLKLFGCPYYEALISGYQSHYQLNSGWQQRIPVHQLHPLAVHAAGQGSYYGAALGNAARYVLQFRQH